MADPIRPKTVDEAVRAILAQMSPRARLLLVKMEREDLSQFHFSWGMVLRDQFGLWDGNTELQDSCGGVHPDECSALIIERVWERLQNALRA